MSFYTERSTISLHRMVNEMYVKNIELARVLKCATQLLMTGVSPNSFSDDIFKSCINCQHEDGGWVSVVDTIWNIKFLTYFNNTEKYISKAIKYLNNNRVEFGFGRSKRDIPRIPVSGIAFYLLPQLSSNEALSWLEDLWVSEKNGLTYKAAYVLMAFRKNNYSPKDSSIVLEILNWLASQQEDNGGFAPWKGHPVGTNIYCTSVAIIGLVQYISQYPQFYKNIEKSYEYICKTQLKNGLWCYHELEDGAAWGLNALTQYEMEYNII